MTLTLIPTDVPVYRVLNTKGFFGPDDTLYEEGAIIKYEGEPNEDMEALNDLAKQKLTLVLEKLDALGKAAAEKAGRPWNGRPRDLDGQIVLAKADEEARVRVMGAEKKNTKIEKLDKEVPETGQKPRRGRPRKTGDLSLAA